MKRCVVFIWLLFTGCLYGQSTDQISRWEQQAKRVTIIRDNWGVPHVYGKTDADCVFGLLYAQCEDDFKRVEANYIDILGRSAEVHGEKNLYTDLYTRLLIDSAAAVADYMNSADWLKKLLDAFADGVNYYLYKHPAVKPALLTRFQPWYHLMWTDGSIAAIQSGGVSVDEVQQFYTGKRDGIASVRVPADELPSGSNGFAIAPSKTANRHAILYINPHVSFYFRPEVHVVSEEGLNAYGAVTWGQLFVYQGFNAHCGWMHTSGYSDVADAYIEQVNKLQYKYEGKWLAVKQRPVTIKYRDGEVTRSKTITTYATHHGPIMAIRNGKWISVRANNRSMQALIQSFQRTKANGFEAFKRNMELLSNASNNTVFADDKGNIAYWHGNFIPRRDTSFNWMEPVDGSIKATEWKGLHPLNETIHLYNPASGWIQNCNSTPFTAAGNSSPRKDRYPAYMAPEPDNFRGINAVRLLTGTSGYTLDKMIATGYDNYLTAFEKLIPALVKGNSDTGAIDTLRAWDFRCSENSVATSLAVEWIQKMMPFINRMQGADLIARVHNYAAMGATEEMTEQLRNVVKELTGKFGTWQVPWGSINRYQRLTGQLQQTFDDAKPSLPSGMVASTWGCLPSFVSRYQPNTKKRYGYNGNSFVCAVEFGNTVKAKSLLTGGNSSDPSSPHFSDQAEMYTKGKFKEVLFYKNDVLKHAERTYHPGE